jgi:cell division protein FtsW
VTSLHDRRRARWPGDGTGNEQPTGGTRVRRAAPPGRRSSTFVTLLGLVLVLNLIGLAMVLSASSVTSLAETGSPWSQFFKQLQWFALGTVAMIVTMRRDYRKWRRHAGWAAIGALVLLVLVILVGRSENDATRWLVFGPFTLQPGEFAKLAFIIFWADLLTRRRKWIEHPRLTVLPVVLSFVVIAGLIMKQPNLGTTMVIFAIMLGMLFVAGSPLRWLALVVAAGTAAGSLALWLSPWRRNRLAVAGDPFSDPLNTGYQTLQALSAAADGGVIGKGLGQGRSKWSYLPEADTDFIFAVLAEEAGLIGALVLIALLTALAVTGIRIAMRAPDRFGMLLAAGIITWFLTQAFLNVGQAVGQLPVVGVPLPFVSSGGSSLLVSMVAVGMLLNVARHTR